MVFPFVYGGINLSKDYTRSGFEFAEEMLGSHRIIRALGVVVKIRCAASPPDFAQAKLSIGKVKCMKNTVLGRPKYLSSEMTLRRIITSLYGHFLERIAAG
jgi:hypothetical protein